MSRRSHRSRISRKPLGLRRSSVGSMPGTLNVDQNAPKPVMMVIGYGSDSFEERGFETVEELAAFRDLYPVLWVHVTGLGDAQVLRGLGELFNLHLLALEDVVNLHQRSKVEEYEETLFVVHRIPSGIEPFDTTQISIFLGKGFVLSFQERSMTWIDPVRDRIRNNQGRIRKAGADYLAYALMDTATDLFFPALDRFGERLYALENDVVSRPDQATVTRIHEIRLELATMRRSVWPMRDALSSLVRLESQLIGPATAVFFRDLADHVFQIMDLVEIYRESGSGLMEVYLSSASTKMNEVMKVLTMIATIFIPLSFMAGFYGMNFNTQKSPWNMPELNWYLGYPFAITLMVVVAAVMLFFFWRKGWLSSRGLPGDDKPPDERGKK